MGFNLCEILGYFFRGNANLYDNKYYTINLKILEKKYII